MTAAPARVLSVTSGKGGVGKTHTSVNLGLALTKRGKRVLLLDADLGLANINVILGFEPKENISAVLSGAKTLGDIIVRDASGLDILPASSGISDLTNLTEGQRSGLIAALEDLAFDYDYLILDTAAGIGDNVMYFNAAAEDVLIVIDHEPTSITDAYALIKVLSARSAVKKFQVIVNRAPVGNDGRSIFSQLAQVSGKFLDVRLQLLGVIQQDSSVQEATLRRRPYGEIFPSTRASLDVGKIAAKIDQDKTDRAPRGGMQFFFRALLEHQT